MCESERLLTVLLGCTDFGTTLSFENHAENKAHKRAAEENLPEKGHREIADKCLKPYRNKFNTGMFKNHSGPEAHDRAHESDGDARSGKRDENRFIFARGYKTERNLWRNPVDKEEARHKADRVNNDHLTKGIENTCICQSARTQAGIIEFHCCNHEKGHQQSID